MINHWNTAFVSQHNIAIIELRKAYFKELSRRASSAYVGNTSQSAIKELIEREYPQFKNAERLLTCAIADLTIEEISTMAFACGMRVEFNVEQYDEDTEEHPGA